MAPKEKWNHGEVNAAREILENAFVANKESEAIWLAAVKLEAENGELAAAPMLLERARSVADTQRVRVRFLPWRVDANAAFIGLDEVCRLPSTAKDLDKALETLSTALEKFPKAAKLYMIQAQVHLIRNSIPAARGALSNGVKACPRDPRLWALASRLEEVDGKSIKARALLEKGGWSFRSETRRRRRRGRCESAEGERDRLGGERLCRGASSERFVIGDKGPVDTPHLCTQPRVGSTSHVATSQVDALPSSSRLPVVWYAVVTGDLQREQTTAQVQVCGCPQEEWG
jgi:pre-mRNA-processing factor 6